MKGSRGGLVLATFIALSVLVVLVRGGLASAKDSPTIRVKWEPGTDFSQYRTFAWDDGQPARDPEVDRLIRNTVENELALDGILPDEVEPSLHVAYYASAKEEVVIQGGYSRNWRQAEAVTVNRYVAGTLVIDLVDASKNQLVWRATANATLTGNLKQSRSRIPGIIAKMFADFPPH